MRGHNSETHAAKKLRSLLERIERLEEERKSIADDIADVYKELVGDGYDKDAAKIVLKIRKAKDGIDGYTAKSGVVDAYLAALGMLPEDASARAPARTRENIEEFRPATAQGRGAGQGLAGTPHDPETGEIRDEPEAAAEAAGDYLREPTAAASGQIIREGDAPRETDRLGGDASRPDAESHSDATPPDASEQPEADILLPSASGAHSDLHPTSQAVVSPAQDAATREAGAVTAAASLFINPRCQRPETCHRAHTKDDCFECSLAWSKRPRDEQRALWREAERKAEVPA